MWSALAGVAGSLLSSGINAGVANQNLEAQKRFYEEQSKLQREQFDYQKLYDANKTFITAKDMENAGLSKTLGVNPSASSVTASSNTGVAQNDFSMDNPLSKFTSDIAQIQGIRLSEAKLEEMRLQNAKEREEIDSRIRNYDSSSAFRNKELEQLKYNFEMSRKHGLRTNDLLPSMFNAGIYGAHTVKNQLSTSANEYGLDSMFDGLVNDAKKEYEANVKAKRQAEIKKKVDNAWRSDDSHTGYHNSMRQYGGWH